MVTSVITSGGFNNLYYPTLKPDGTKLYLPFAVGSTVDIVSTSTNNVTSAVSDPSLTFNLPFPMTATPLPRAPECPKGRTVSNTFIVQVDLVNIVSWCTPVFGSKPIYYNISRDAALTDLITTIPATDPNVYEDHNRVKGVTYTYYIVAVDVNGTNSVPAFVSITMNC